MPDCRVLRKVTRPRRSVPRPIRVWATSARMPVRITCAPSSLTAWAARTRAAATCVSTTVTPVISMMAKREAAAADAFQQGFRMRPLRVLSMAPIRRHHHHFLADQGISGVDSSARRRLARPELGLRPVAVRFFSGARRSLASWKLHTRPTASPFISCGREWRSKTRPS